MTIIIYSYILIGLFFGSIGCSHIIRTVIPNEKETPNILSKNTRLFITFIILTLIWPFILMYAATKI